MIYTIQNMSLLTYIHITRRKPVSFSWAQRVRPTALVTLFLGFTLVAFLGWMESISVVAFDVSVDWTTRDVWTTLEVGKRARAGGPSEVFTVRLISYVILSRKVSRKSKFRS